MREAWAYRANRLVDVLRGRPSRRELYRSLIASHAPGRSVADVGCMWRVHGDYAFHALASGATDVVGVDVSTPTAEFTARNAAAGNRVRFVQGDINDPATLERIGPVDVVFCAGVLYHMPNPLHTLGQLHRLTGKTLIIGSVTIAEQESPQAAVFLPFLERREAKALSFSPEGVKVGVDTAFSRDQPYANWFWGFSPSAVGAMLRAVGFEVREQHDFRRAVCFVCDRR